MENKTIDIARNLLLAWISSGEANKSYESIRRNCTYLDKAYSLGLGDNAVWTLFRPLLIMGVIDYVGNDFYAMPEPVAIRRGDIYVYTGLPSESDKNKTSFTGIFRSLAKDCVPDLKVTSFDAYAVLRKMPSLDKVVDSFEKTIVDLTGADYYHWKGHKGLTKRLGNGIVRYFCIPEKMYQREVPSRVINPDAFSIAYNLSRSINGESSGTFISANKSLRMKMFGLPIMIGRLLFLESLTKGLDPIRKENEIEYPGITKETVKELNRVLCNTLRNE